MNREIKFRGKRIDNGEWVYGSHAINNTGYHQISDWSDDIRWWHFVDPDTVGQFTGLKDKNGVDIYEGDIVTGLAWLGGNKMQYTGIIKYRYSGFRVHGIREWEHSTFNIDGNTIVKGNVHQTPSLLEVTP